MSLAWRSGTVAPLHVLPDIAPSAPGNRPNIVSNVRFSLIRKMTCLMCCRASATWESDGEGFTPGAGDREVHAEPRSAAAATRERHNVDTDVRPPTGRPRVFLMPLFALLAGAAGPPACGSEPARRDRPGI